MFEHSDTAPRLRQELRRGSASISAFVDDLIGAAGLRAVDRSLTPESLELIGLAVTEVLHSIVELCGDDALGPRALAELWIGDHLSMLVLRFHGRPLPGWLIANWDRAQEPEVLASPGCSAGGWMLVREALDGVSYCPERGAQVLYLERWIR